MIPYEQRNASGMESTAPRLGNIDKLIEKGSAPTDQPGRARKGEKWDIFICPIILSRCIQTRLQNTKRHGQATNFYLKKN